MFERYKEIERRVIFSSRRKAHHVGSLVIDTEHLLLGLLATDMGLARRFLGSPWRRRHSGERLNKTDRIRKPIHGPVDLPLSSISKRVLRYAVEEADMLSSKHISSEHLLLGMLREENCFAAEFLHEHGVRLASTREELIQIPHNDSATAQFVRER